MASYFTHPPIGNVTISTTGSGYNSGNYVLTSSGTSTTSWTMPATTMMTANPVSNALDVTGDANFKGDVKIDGVSVRDTLRTINERLAILVPDPKKLEKYEALQKAYKHYKLLEAMITDDDLKRTDTE